MSRNNRTLREPRQQIKVSIWFFTGLTAAFAIFLVLSLRSVHQSLVELAAGYQIQTEHIGNISNLLMILMMLTLFASGTAIVAGVIAGYTLERRLFGPLVPIRKLIEELTNGNFKARGSLRKNDEFQDVMNDLNVLAAKLEASQTQKM